MESWTAAHTAAKVSSLGSEYAAAWAGSSLTGRDFAAAAPADLPNLLRDAGVTSLGIRKKLAKAIEAWKLDTVPEGPRNVPGNRPNPPAGDDDSGEPTRKPAIMHPHTRIEKKRMDMSDNVQILPDRCRTVDAPRAAAPPLAPASPTTDPSPPKRRRIAPQFLGAAKEERVAAKAGPLEDWTARKEDALNHNIVDPIGYACNEENDGEAMDEIAPDASAEEEEREMERILDEEGTGRKEDYDL
ncbi:hypothetical protein HDU86_006238 [Geranomyces michiganensis]|nr:hypothetical protein HDU86_006238 [Geranomyces michiganensis]